MGARPVGGPSVLDGPGQPIGLELGPDLRDIVPEHDDIVVFTVGIADMVPEQRFRLETEALEHGDRRALIDSHLRDEFFEAGA
jgi:hypothetical protein